MGRPKENPVRNSFTYNVATNKSTCRIGGCGTTIAGNHAANLERHMQRHHKDEYAELQAQKPNSNKRGGSDVKGAPPAKRIDHMLGLSVNVQIQENDVIQGCVEMVTKNGRPFAAVEDSGFRKILDPILKAFGGKLRINAEMIKNCVTQEASDARKVLAHKLQDRLISLKIDCANRLDRAVLGVNVQYIEDGKLVLQTLAMRELFERHTGKYLKSEVLDVLSMYGVRAEQVYSITTDNGANMIKAVELLREEELEETALLANDDEEEDSAQTGDYLSELEQAGSANSDEPLVQGVRCAAHTLQLAVHDALKNEEAQETVGKCRALTKLLRTQTMMSLIRKLQLKKPVIDTPTRWMSTSRMIRRLLELREFCDDLLTQPNSFTSDHWTNAEGIIHALAPAEEATKRLQSEQLVMGDFLGVWLKCRMESAKMATPLATALASSMDKRQKTLLENDVFCSAVFLDPRYRVLLTDIEKERAKQRLCSVWSTMKRLVQDSSGAPAEAPDTPQPGPSHSDSGNVDELEVFLNEQEQSAAVGSRSLTSETEKLMHLLELFSCEPRIKKEVNILEYWKREELKKPQLFQLARVALAVPATQVSVERAFSGLRYILSPQRGSLSPDTLDDIMLLRSLRV
ncbi:uncharacterized protein LOC135373352 [Ornithodoros turicata]|uniref:uncharacterized protein LOC135373352 n=1 Tax=Ornithodoros turicata TaxID=34597 RepID=UPI003139EF75